MLLRHMIVLGESTQATTFDAVAPLQRLKFTFTQVSLFFLQQNKTFFKRHHTCYFM